MKVVLAEKPSVARDIAAHLGCSKRQDGYLEGNGYQVTWAFGHLVTLKQPDDYDPALKKWSIEGLPFIPPRFELKATGDKQARAQLAVIKKLFRASSTIICATDAGREGELIFRYILSLTGCTTKPAKRLWLSSLTPEAIRGAFKNLRPLSDYDNLYAAARSRSEADWIVGLNGTRYFTAKNPQDKTLWSVGRVQTPVLALIANRDIEIEDFQSTPFWELQTAYRETLFRYTKGRFDKERVATKQLKRIKRWDLVIDSVETKEQRSAAPQLFDLTELQREINRRFGVSAADTLKAVQSLYEQKLVTYPRTDSRYLTKDMEPTIPGIFRELSKLRQKEIGGLNLDSLTFSARITNDKKVTDHHAIIPTGKIPTLLNKGQQQVYDQILTRFIAAFYPPCLKQVTSISAHSRDLPFLAKGTRVVSAGWTVLYSSSDGTEREGDDQLLPEFRVGEAGPHEPSIREGKTAPPKHFTESSLLGAMETAGKEVEEQELREALKKRGLGTPATRAAVIETLLKREYIKRSKSKITATKQGRYLLQYIQDESLKSAELTGDWEARLTKIARGDGSAAQFMDNIAEYARQIIGSNETASKKQLPKPEALRPQAKTLGQCPVCGASVTEQTKSYSCSRWKDGCKFTIWKTVAGKKVARSTAVHLLNKGKSSVLKGFTSKAGKPFEARLVLTKGGVEFEFPRKRRS